MKAVRRKAKKYNNAYWRTIMRRGTKEQLELESKGREEVNASNLEAHVAYFCSLGEKLAGNPEEKKACDYIVKIARELGAEAQVHEFESYVSHPVSASFTAIFPERLHVEGVGVSFGMSTPEAGLSGEVVYCGMGSPTDFAAVDCAGKVALVGRLPNPEVCSEAAAHGAIGLVTMSEGHMKHKMIASPVWGTPGGDDYRLIPRIPVVSISGDDGEKLKRLAKSGQMRGTLFVENREGWKTLRLPVVEIKGSRPEYLLVGAHYCSWFDGGTDNASGDACLLELVKLFKKYQENLGFGIRFAWWPGHSHGRYSGSGWYADTFWQDLYDNCIGYFNIDSPGVRGAHIYVPRHQMAEVSEFNEGCVGELTRWSTVKSHEGQLTIGARFGKYVNATRPSRAADQSFWGVGLTSIGVYSMLAPDHPDRRKHVGGSGGAWWWHSIDDTADKCDPEVLAQDTRLYWSIIFRLLTSPVLPYDFTATVQDYEDALREYDEESGSILDFSTLKANLGELKSAAERFSRKSKEMNFGPEADRATRLCLRLARALNPTLYTRVEPTEQQAALGTRFLSDLEPALSIAGLDPESWQFKFSRAGLVRKINKINLTVLTALRLIQDWEARA